VSWQPQPQVRIGGVDFSGQTVGEVSVSRGRRTVYETPNAGYCSVELRDVGDMPPLEVGSPVQVFVADSAGTATQVFGGLLADWSSRTVVTGGVPLVSYRVQAVGPLARLNRRRGLFGGRPSEDDGERVLAALGLLSSSWEELRFNLTWGAVEGTWTDQGGFDPALVDPGVFTLAALGTSDAGYSGLQVAQDAGFSGEGILYETRTGMAAYADADRRYANEQAGFLTVPAAVLSADGLGVFQSLSDITNRVTVEYDGGAVTTDDQFSIVRFGLYESEFRTDLVNLSNASARARSFIERHAAPENVLDELRFGLASQGTALRDALLLVEPNDALEITGIPSRVGFTRFQGFVEGVSWSIGQFEVRLSLTVSDKSLSVGSVRWGQVGATLEWGDVDATLSWQDAREVTV